MHAVRGPGRGVFWLALFIAVIALVAAGCGSSGNDNASTSGNASTAAKTTSTAATPAAPLDTPDPQPAVAPRSGGSGTPIKLAIMSECKGAFGAFDNQNMAGAVAALSQFAGAKPKDPNNPRAGFTGGAIGDHPIKLVGIGCGDDSSDTAIKEVRRLMEQLDADVMVGPLSGDESIAVANYAKQHPDKTFVDGSAGAQDTTLKVQAPNFYRFNGDGAQWNAGLGDIAYNKLGWRKAAVVADDYSFAWTSAAGFIAEFCAAGGQITKRVFPPLNTTDYSSYAQ
jgi:branched-chain amino acid transport system substrate-binding protein